MHEKQDAFFAAQFTEDAPADYSYQMFEREMWQAHLREACNQFIVQWTPLIYKACHFACARSRNSMRAHDVEDLFQDTVLALYKSLEDYDPARGPLVPRLIFVAKMYAITSYRNSTRKKVLKIKAKQIKNEHLIPAPEVASGEKVDILNMLNGLEPWEKNLVLLKLHLNLSNVYIAKALGRAESVIRYHLQRILGSIKVSGT